MIGCLRAEEPMYLFTLIQNEWEFKLLTHSSFPIWNDEQEAAEKIKIWNCRFSFHIRKANLKIHTYSQFINMIWRALPSMIWAAAPAWIDKPKSSSDNSQVHQACLEQVCQKEKKGWGKNETKKCNTETHGEKRKSKI